MTTDRVAAIVKTVLYEGYALYPYRPSALKNQKRFAFGAVYPRAWATLAREPFTMRAECVIEAAASESAVSPEVEVEITIGFLVLHRGGGGTEHTIRLEPRALTPAEWHEARTSAAPTAEPPSLLVANLEAAENRTSSGPYEPLSERPVRTATQTRSETEGSIATVSPLTRPYEPSFERPVRTTVRTRSETEDSIACGVSDNAAGAGPDVVLESAKTAPAAAAAAHGAVAVSGSTVPNKLSVLVTGSIVDAGGGLWRVALEIENVTAIDAGADREAAMDITLASTHVLMRAVGGVAISTTDPPPHAADAVASCRTLGCYPVVVARDTVLASPIVLADFPRSPSKVPATSSTAPRWTRCSRFAC